MSRGKQVAAVHLITRIDTKGDDRYIVSDAKAVTFTAGDLAAMQALVGGMIEFAPCDPNRDIEIVCDEEGLLHGEAVVNHAAMELWAEVDSYGCIPAGNVLVGSVIVVGRTNRHGNSTDCPAWVFARFGLEVPE